MTTTHDLPTIAGWWQGNDISWREKLGLIHSDAELNKAKKTRERDRQALWEALTPEAKRVGDGSSGDYAKPSGEKADQEGRRQSNRIPEISEAGAEEIVDKVIRFVGGTDCPVAIIPVEDLLGLSEQPNIPGTIAVHPNWCRRYPNVSKSLLSRRAVLKRLAALRSERPER
ncbi:hypothetical protein AOE01nite_02850 [Acetobacter oeni]|uniref:4-alpha-glucanotransferase n=2 Tax=Acetobacter oeni TaxID=304077 RepID=A0A511XGN6_9PROT|nr:hypothetical protein AOE01nite_02850 [Acetobacter oeni]